MATKLSNVIGAPFQDYVMTQLYTRAAHNSTINRTNTEVLFLANKTSWARLVSSVNVELEAAELENFYTTLEVGPIAKNKEELAKNWILEAGTSIQNGNGITLRQGIGINGAYGLGGTEELGYRPMPGLTSVSIETAGRLGSLRTATINFKVWNMNQLNVIEALYFRLGYSMLLEWGHTQYYKNNSNTGGDWITNGIYGIEDPFILGTRKEAIQQNIARKGRATSGNYDGMLGIVSNFNWSFNQEGGYDCNVKLVGLGAVMDSLRLNQTYKLPQGLLQAYKKSQANLSAEVARLAKLVELQAIALSRRSDDTAEPKSLLPPNPPKNLGELYEYAQGLDGYKATIGQFASSSAYFPAPIGKGPNLVMTNPDYYYLSTAKAEKDRETYNEKYFQLFLRGNGRYWRRLKLKQIFPLDKAIVEGSVEYYLTNQLSKEDAKVYTDVKGYSSLLGKYFYVSSDTEIFVTANPTGAPIVSTIARRLSDPYNSGEFQFSFRRLTGPDPSDAEEKQFVTTVSFKHDATYYSLTRQQVLEAFEKWWNSSKRQVVFDEAQQVGSDFLVGDRSLFIKASVPIPIPNVKSTGYSTNLDEYPPTATVNLRFNFTFNDTNYVDAFGIIDVPNPNTAETKKSTPPTGDLGGTVRKPATAQVDAASGYESALHAMLTFVKSIAQSKSLKSSAPIVPISIYDETSKFYQDGVLQNVLTATGSVSPNPDGVPFDVTKYGQKGFSSNLMVDGAEKGLGLYDETANVDFKKLCTAIVAKYIYGSDRSTLDITVYPVYIPLGYLLAFLNNMCLIYDSIQSATPASSTSGTDKRPYIYIDFNPETNFCLTSPQQLSVDPKICLIPVNATDDQYASIFPPEIAAAIKSKLFKPASQSVVSKALDDVGLNFKTTSDAYQGKTMNILLNIDYLLEQADKFTLADPEHSVNLKPFLEQIMIDVNKCLGNMNLFRIAYRDDSNTVQIQDDQWVPSLSSEPNAVERNQFISGVHVGQLPVFGKQSLARQFQFKTNVSTKLGSMIAISAQAQTGSVNAKDHSELSYLNKNFRDRYKPFIQDPSNGPTGAGTKPTTKGADQNNDVKIASNFNDHVLSVYSSFFLDQEKIAPAKNYLIERLSKVKSEDPITSAAPFIPADLEITIDGISGIIMGNAFTIPEDRLPLSLRGEKGFSKVGFIVTGLTHTVENNQWLTKIKGQMIRIRQDLARSAAAAINSVVKQFVPPGSTAEGGGGGLKLREGYPYPGAMADVFDENGKKVDGYSGARQVLSPNSVNSDNFSTVYYPGYQFKRGTSDINLSKKGLTPLTDTGIIDDTTQNRFNIGKLSTPTSTFVVHHTGGLGGDWGSAEATYTTFYARGLPAQYVIDRKGGIHRFLPDGAFGWHAGPNYNRISMGVEVVAANDKDVLPIQVEAAARLIQYLGYSKNQIVGHGEIAPKDSRGFATKEPSEGKKIVDYIKNNL